MAKAAPGAPTHHAHCQRGARAVVLGHDLSACAGDGRWFHPYPILDLYSRKIVGREVHVSDDSPDAIRTWPTKQSNELTLAVKDTRGDFDMQPVPAVGCM